MNSAILMGRMTADAEIKTTQSGKEVTSFTVAVDKYTKKGEDRQANFIDVVAWEKTATFINQYFHKGSMIALQGSIQTRTYEDKNGNKRKAVEVLADRVYFCGGKQDKPANTEPNIDFEEIGNDEELPF